MYQGMAGHVGIIFFTQVFEIFTQGLNFLRKNYIFFLLFFYLFSLKNMIQLVFGSYTASIVNRLPKKGGRFFLRVDIMPQLIF